jgi:hypothetical protein
VTTPERTHRRMVGLTKGSLKSSLCEFRLSFGTIRMRISTSYTRRRGVRSLGREYSCAGKQHKHIVASLEPNFGFASVLEWTLIRGYSPWSMSFKAFNLRPDWSPIFDYCISGNIAGVRSLIENGHASPTDIDSEGMTPLHVSIVLFRRSNLTGFDSTLLAFITANYVDC